jgi:hypothetical protein
MDSSFDHLKAIKLNFFRLSHLNMHLLGDVAGISEDINFQS